ncbi:LOW QUALITY PROTEIN: uncharacterized protein LOC113511324 [Galleria mellonella]|uniref:LOW QUALITY PROTEIN: uncharacterized protein LOC113511324 n=1 Tax=Galleria mellonella TaxID=7137 RepID=A0A6J1WI74_GALME|nr:LOW QUALITY PROTEIN: uncharacterized protein LOC113511324 [Galleria mellonella]
MSKLEKFKRRLIRTVARLRQQKIPEDKLWMQLQKNTKCDCRWMWNHMRTLTIKRLKRLLLAVDRHENITAVARMTLTDWMMCDFILVHEKIDLIGASLNLRSEPLSLLELFSLVQRFGVEGRSGDELASAWTAATIQYNYQGRQCSPMLLQRRWYQMKDLTRNRFYNFWFAYRGNAKYLDDARAQHGPTKLQMAIAKRYPHIITMPFLSWEELIEKRLAILPDEFEVKMRTLNNTSDLPKPCDENSPDLIIVEPEIEVIDLRVNSESETEYDEQDMVTEAQKMLGVNEMDGKSRDSSSIDAATDSHNTKTTSTTKTTSQKTTIKVEPQETNTEVIDEIDDLYDCEDLATTVIPSDIGDNAISRIANPVVNSQENINEIFSEEQATDLTEDPSSNEIPIVAPEPMMMPLITNVFGNVHIENEALVGISNALLEKNIDESVVNNNVKTSDVVQSNSVDQVKTVNNEIEEIDLEEDIISTVDVNKSTLNNRVAEDKSNIKSEVDNFEDMSINLTMIDDGIELVDDGIELSDEYDDVDTRTKPSSDKDKTKINIKTECGTKENEDNPKFDLKLLMDPVVYTTKLDDMNYFKTNNFTYVKDITNINDIIIESKPVSKRSIDNSRKENTVEPTGHLEENYMNDDLFDNNSIVNEKSVLSDSENEDVPEKMKVSLSSVLLQKPRARTYDFINLCKNPDFNTRLKRLTVGFLSSTRNRQLLKACKPMTVDVNKVFESKLINNTLYLKSCQMPKNAKPVSDISVEASSLGEQTRTIVPSAMSVQSLIDNTKINMEDLLQTTLVKTNSEPNNSQESSKNLEDLRERKKIICLPDINNVRRINQKLLIAEVTPIRIQIDNEKKVTPPVQIVSQDISSDIQISSANSEKKVSSITKSVTKVPNITCNIEKVSNQNSSNINARKTINIDALLNKGKLNDLNSITDINIMKDSTLNAPKNGKNIDKTSSLHTRTQIPRFSAPISWLNPNKNTKCIDSLLTMDTLNKMLNVICPDIELSTTMKDNKKSKAFRNQASELQKNLEEFERISKNAPNLVYKVNSNLSNSVSPETNETNLQTLVAKSIAQNQTSSHKMSIKRKKIKTNIIPRRLGSDYNVSNKYCCWARERINEAPLKSIRNHKHTLNQCTCCCKLDLVEFLKKKENFFARSTTDDAIILPNNDNSSLQKACETIERVVEESRKLCSNNEHEKPINSTTDTIPSITNKQDIISAPVEVISSFVDMKCTSTDMNLDTNIKNIAEVPSTDGMHSVATTVSVNINTDNKASQLPEVQNICPDSSFVVSDIINVDEDDEDTKNPVNLESDQPSSNPVPVNVTELPFTIIVKPRISSVNVVSSAEPGIKSSISTDKSLSRQERLINKRRPTEQRLGHCDLGKQLVIDGTKGLQSSNIQITNNVIVLSKIKQIQSPIYLGQNKILLTDVKLSKKNTNANQMPILGEKSLLTHRPVNTVLLPLGAEMTYVDIDPELISNTQIPFLPKIDKPVNSLISSNDTSRVISTNQDVNEIINLSDDENSNSENSEVNQQVKSSQRKEINSSSESVTDTSITDCHVIISDQVSNSTLSKMDSSNTNTETITTNPPSNVKDNNIDDSNIQVVNIVNNKDVPLIAGEKTDNEIDCSEIKSTGLALAETEITPIADQRSINNTDEVEQNKEQDINQPEDTNIEHEESNSTNVQRKSILSDLMEMSGISADDTTPNMPVDVTQQPVLLSHDAVLNVSNPIVDFPQLYPVTSFRELKYACEKNGNFFKCDLDTGILSVINVSIKKNPKKIKIPALTPIAPKTRIIDLTDDNDEKTPTIKPKINNKDSKRKKQRKKIKNINKEQNSGNAKAKARNLLPKNTAKPIKLFKVSYPSILKRNKIGNVSHESCNEEIKKSDMKHRINVKRKRKQQFDDTDRNTIHTFDVSDKLREQADDSQDNSSDDEPLANKSKRLRQEETKVNNADVESETGGIYKDCTTLTPDLIDELPSNRVMESIESESHPTISFISDIDMSQEDCVLGV